MNYQEIIVKIDRLASQILENGGDAEDLLIGMIGCSNDFYRLIKTVSTDEMDRYCKQYPGFYAYAKVLNDLAIQTSKGKAPDFLKSPKSKPKAQAKGSIKSDSNRKSLEELQQIMANALLQMRDLVGFEEDEQAVLIPKISVFLLSVISMAADMIELATPGGGAFLYAEIEAGAKNGGISSIAKVVKENSPHYSVSGIDSDDIPTAMNYVGQQLAITLTKALHELPMALRRPETQVRGIEALLANLLSQKFTNAHEILDSLCDHVHMALSDLGKNTQAPNLH